MSPGRLAARPLGLGLPPVALARRRARRLAQPGLDMAGLALRGLALPDGLAIAGLAALMLLNGNVLHALGIPYAEDGGPPWSKLHPGSALLLLAGGLALAQAGATLATPDWRHPLWRGLCALALLSLPAIAGLWLQGPPGVVVMADTFLPAAALCLVLAARPQAAGPMRAVLLGLLAGNAALAVAEALLGANLVPQFLIGAANGAPGLYQPDAAEFRATGLADHPLSGAALAMLGSIAAATLPARAPGRLFMAANWLALLAFGGRAAALGALVALAWRHRGMRLSALRLDGLRLDGKLGLALLAVPVGLLLLLAAVIAGVVPDLPIGGRLLGHAGWDDSAAARLQLLPILLAMPVDSLLFGMPRAAIIALQEPARLQYGAGVLENCWALLFLAYGAVGLGLIAAGLSALAACVRGLAGRPGLAMLLLTLLVASTANSLARKSPLLTLSVAASLVCAHPLPPRRSRRA